MNTLYLAGAAALAIVVGGVSVHAATAPAKAKPAAAIAKAGPKLGSFGVDTAGMDKAVKPGDDAKG